MENLKSLMFLENYCNYFNRKVFKPLTTAADYAENQVLANKSYNYLASVNFNPNDGVETTHIVNTALWNKQFTPDYMVVLDENNVAISHWFVTEWIRTRAGQFKVNLKRDTIADNYDKVINAPCFIERATLEDDDPLILNDEGMIFNQIKSAEYLLKDQSKSAWIIGYLSRQQEEKTISLSESATWDISLQDFNSKFNNAFNSKEFSSLIGQTRFEINISNGIGTGINTMPAIVALLSNGFHTSTKVSTQPRLSGFAGGIYKYNVAGEMLAVSASEQRRFTNEVIDDLVSPSLKNQLYSYYSVIDDSNDIGKYNNKILYDSENNKYYRISLTKKSEEYVSKDFGFSEAVGTEIKTILTDAARNASIFLRLNTSGKVKIEFTKTVYDANFDDITNQVAVKISANRRHLYDAPYDMFAIPYGTIDIIENQQTITSNKDVAEMISQVLSAELGNNLYDVQLLPYCPFNLKFRTNNEIDVSLMEEDKDYNWITSNSSNSSILFWCTKSNFTFDIPLNLFVENPKIESNCDVYRLISPNYQGQFEFNLAKNGGLSTINVDCTYRPYTPYIHLNPDFKLLYGNDFNDCRGLICGGDFSCVQMNDAWINYQIQNKNYQNIFDREIASLEYQRKFQRISEATAALSGAGGAGAAAALVGMGPIGIAGAAGASALGGAFDIYSSEKMYKENISYRTDMFNYRLGNIQALPQSIAKTSAFVYNNKLWPVLEYYTCTDRERKALEDKITYNGMTVMKIGTIAEYLKPELTFIQGQIIRLDIADDTHLLNVIYEEIKKGVYI